MPPGSAGCLQASPDAPDAPGAGHSMTLVHDRQARARGLEANYEHCDAVALVICDDDCVIMTSTNESKRPDP